MKFAYLEDGTVTGLNRAGVAPDELTGNCTPQELVWGMVAEYYLAPTGSLEPLSAEEVDVLKAVDAKQSAYDTTLAGFEDKKTEENLKDFTYDENTYLSDKDSIQATQNEALAGVGTDSIHTLVGTPYAGMWAAVGAFVPFTNAEFLLLATEFFKRGSDNFTTRSVHKMNLDAMMEDPTKTAEDILNYDYSEGWK